ncbi:hypothetical protein N1F89_07350, partial [Aquibium sp. A9E412]|uniref:hypothetical protein n=1 Tax=Aquibium sp. A9E412 TaxID=2976767 RepID=UPI0025AEE23B
LPVPKPLLAGWLAGALLALGLPLGALTMLMIHALTGGAWGDALRQPLRAVAATLPAGLLLLVPVLAALGEAFPWAAAETADLPESVRHKLAYLNAPFFTLRFAATAAVWLVLCWRVLALTAPAATAADRRPLALRRWAAGGLVLHALAVSVLSVDWMMSLEPEFFSTIYPLLVASAQTVGAYALATLVLARRRDLGALPAGDAAMALGEDVANMLFGLVLMWAYLAFMQFLIVWAADLPREIGHYLTRTEGGWQVVLWLVLALHVAVPLLAFPNRRLKRSRRGVAALAATLVAAHALETVWRVAPPLAEAGGPAALLSLAGFAAAAAAWAAVFLLLLPGFPIRLPHPQVRHG